MKPKDNFLDRVASVDQKALLEEQKRQIDELRNIIGLIPGNVYVVDVNGICFACNNNLAEISGFELSSQLVGKSSYDFMPPELAEKTKLLNLEVVRTKQVKIFEEAGINKHGKLAVYLTEKIPLLDSSGNVSKIMGISIDITYRKQAEQLAVEKQLMAEKLALTEAFTGFMAHELRTPIASLNTVLDTIEGNEKTPDPTKRQETLEQIIARGKQTVRGANSFIDMLLYKLRNMSKTVKKEELDLCLILDDVADALSDYPFTEVENTQFTLEKKNAFVYYGNSLHTKHIIFNLLKNALKIIAEEQKGHITISFEQGEGRDEGEGGDWNKLIFTDTAKGIAPEFLPTIFDAFITKDDTKKGTGLGLAYCKLVMQGYGGDIACESKLGEYTRFVCTFPKVKIDEL